MRRVVVALCLVGSCVAAFWPSSPAEALDEAERSDLHREAALLLEQGRRLANAGRQHESVPFYRRSLDYLAVIHGTGSAELARRELELARVLRDAGQRAVARGLLEELVRRLRRQERHPELLASARNDLERLRDPETPRNLEGRRPPPAPESDSPTPPERRGPVYRAQLMARQSRAEAERQAARLRAEYAPILRGLPSHFETADLGDRGLWHRVQFGDFATFAAAAEICDRLRRAGWDDCLVATP